MIINNGAHDSVGGQPTAGQLVDLVAVAKACRYRSVARVDKAEELPSAVHNLRLQEGPALLEILTHIGARDDLGRPTINTTDNKMNFMRNLSE